MAREWGMLPVTIRFAIDVAICACAAPASAQEWRSSAGQPFCEDIAGLQQLRLAALSGNMTRFAQLKKCRGLAEGMKVITLEKIDSLGGWACSEGESLSPGRNDRNRLYAEHGLEIDWRSSRLGPD